MQHCADGDTRRQFLGGLMELSELRNAIHTEVLFVGGTIRSRGRLCRLLSANGYTILQVNNPTTAMLELTHPEHRPALVLLDVRGPGADGLEWCRQVTKLPGIAPRVVFLAGLKNPVSKSEIFKAGGSDCLVEPFVNEEVLACVKTHLSLTRLTLANHLLTQELAARRASEITERTLANAKLLELNQQLHALFDAAMEVAIIATNAQGSITVFNSGAEKMLGYSAQEMLGQSAVRFLRSSELAICADELTEMLGHPVAQADIFSTLTQGDGSDIRNWTYVRKDGKSLRVSMALSAVRDEQDNVIGCLGIARDITEQLAAQANLLKLNLQLDNRVRERTLALEQSSEQLQLALDDLRQTQSKLIQSEKLAGLGSIVAAVAHELNTPLGICVTVASTLQEKTDIFDALVTSKALRRSQLEDYLANTRQAMALLARGLSRASDLVANFKRVAVDQSSSQRRQFDLKDVVDDVVALLLTTLRKKPYRVELDVPAGLKMDSFPGAIEQLVTNLINNSVLHGFAERDHGVMHLQAFDAGNAVRLVYRDDGHGMTADVLSHIFDPFFTTTFGKGGSGLGMSVCYNLITGPLGGTIEVSSTLGEGACFTIVLPHLAPQRRASAGGLLAGLLAAEIMVGN